MATSAPTLTPNVALTSDLSEAILNAARECIGTPFRHQGRNPGRGLDCVGLVRHPAIEVGFAPKGTDFAAYGRFPQPITMMRILGQYFELIDPSIKQPGDIMWMSATSRSDQTPQHLGLWTGDTIIHAMATGPCKVVEHPFRHPFPGRVTAWFRYKKLAPDV